MTSPAELAGEFIADETYPEFAGPVSRPFLPADSSRILIAFQLIDVMAGAVRFSTKPDFTGFRGFDITNTRLVLNYRDWANFVGKEWYSSRTWAAGEIQIVEVLYRPHHSQMT